MITKAVLEIIINLDRFRNIDTYFQGLYYIQLTCDFPNYQAEPLELIGPNQFPTHSPHFMKQAFIHHQKQAICTQVFLLRYSDQQVSLNHTGVFRVQIPVQRSFIDNPLTITARLLTSDLGGGGVTFNKIQSILRKKEVIDFTEVSTATFLVPNSLLCVNSLMPFVFEQFYSSVLTCSFHSLLLDFKFSCNQKQVLLEDTFFPGCQQVRPENMDRVYQKYVMLLAVTHNKIRDLLLKVLRSANIMYRLNMVPQRIKLPLSSQKEQTLSEFLFTRERKEVSNFIFEEIQEISSRVVEIKVALLENIKNSPQCFINCLQQEFHKKLTGFYNSQFISNERSIKNLSRSSPNTPKSHLSQSKEKRKYQFSRHEKPQILDTFFFCSIDTLPILFEQKIQNQPIQPAESSTIHLFVLVHGFMASSYDMKQIRDTLGLCIPKAMLLISQSNQNIPHLSIQSMGSRLAIEISMYIQEKVQQKHPFKLSFIGHSLGAVVIRAALPNLQCYQQNMHLFLSLNSPHLGCMGSSKLMDAGIWMMMRLKRSQSLKELMLSDNKNWQQTYMYKLSQTEGLQWFSHIILLSSSQDNYVPFQSARIEGSKSFWTGQSKYYEMSENLLKKIKRAKITRLDANFFGKKKGIQKVGGRFAHIEVLKNSQLLMAVIYRYPEAFS